MVVLVLKDFLNEVWQKLVILPTKLFAQLFK